MAITKRHTFGWNLETQLKPIFESLHDITLIKTVKRFDSIDFTGIGLNIELKSRTGKSTDYPTWLLPTCKATYAEEYIKENGEREVYFYYFWKNDNKLFRLRYDTEGFALFERQYPFFNPKQEHFFIPADAWEYVGVVDLKNGCLVGSAV